MLLRVCVKIISGFVGSAAWPDARHEGGSVSKTIHDRPSNNADGPAPPRPCGLGLLGSLALLLIPYRPKQVCASFAPRQKSQLPPAKSELIFAQTLIRKYWIALLLALILGCVSGSAGLRVQFATNEFIINRIGQVYTVQIVMDSDEADAMQDLALYSFALKLSFPSSKALAGTNSVTVAPVMDNDGFDTGKARRIAGPGYVGAWGLIGLTNKFYGPSTNAMISPAGTWPLLASFTITNLAGPGESYELTLGRINDTMSDEWTYAEEGGARFVAFDADLDFGVATVTINSPPTISAIGSQTISLGAELKPFKFTIDDAETDLAELTINLSSSNPELVSPDEISVEGEGSERILTAPVAEGKTGQAQITVTIDDGQLATSSQFHIIVQIPDTRPRFKSVQRVEDNIIRLTIEAQPGTSLTLQASSDCKTWTTLKSVIVDAPLMILDDWMEDSNVKRFYRLIQ